MYPLTDYQAAYMTYCHAKGYQDRIEHNFAQEATPARIYSTRELVANATDAYVAAILS